MNRGEACYTSKFQLGLLRLIISISLLYVLCTQETLASFGLSRSESTSTNHVGTSTMCKSRFYTCGFEKTVPWSHGVILNRTEIVNNLTTATVSHPLPRANFLELLKDYMQETFKSSGHFTFEANLNNVVSMQQDVLKRNIQGNHSSQKLLCNINVVNVLYRHGERHEQPMYARVLLEENCLWNSHDWIFVEMEPLMMKGPEVMSPTLNEMPLVEFPRKGEAVVDIPCLGNGGKYNMLVFYMAPKCLGSTHCSTKYVPGGILRLPLANESVEIKCPQNERMISLEKSDVNSCLQFPSRWGMGYFRGQSWHPYCPQEKKVAINESDNIVIHLVGDSTMEEIYFNLARNVVSKLKEDSNQWHRSSGCGGGILPEDKSRPCHHWHGHSAHLAFFSFTLFTEPMGWSNREHLPNFGGSPNWASASISETVVFLKKVKKDFPSNARHVVLFNYGLHGTSNHGIFQSVYERTLLQLRSGIEDFASLVAVSNTPSNPTRPSYQSMTCGTEPITAMLRGTIACIAEKHKIPFFDRYMLQYGQWNAYRDSVHLKKEAGYEWLLGRIIDELVKAALDVAHAGHHEQ